MELREHLLKAKRFYEEEEKKYKGPDPLKIRCEFISCLERYDKASIEDIYLPFLEETLKQFVEYPIYKQDLRFIQLWLNYSATQPNPVEVMERMHSKGLGTECGILYSSWAKLLIKRGLLSNADSVFKMGLTNNVKAKSDLQKQYDEFLRDVGQKALLGQLVCPKCGSSCKNCTGNVANPEGATGSSDEEVLVWEWNPLKVGDKDDFKCPMAYFEEPDSSKIRMYPRDKVYPASGDEFSLEEILAEEYERKYEEEARLKVLAEAKAREEESRRARQELNELRKIEAEKFNSISELNPPATTSKMLNLKPDIDNTLANSTTFTVHMKEAMNVVQCMWSSPTPSEVRPSLFRSETGQKDLVPQAPPAKPTTFEIFSEDDPSHQTPKHHKPFQIYDENADQRAANRQPAKPKIPFEIYDENAPPNQDMYLPTKQPSALKHKTPFEIYDEMKTPNEKLKNVNAQNPNSQPTSKFKLFPDEDNVSDLPEKLETQAKLQPFFNVQDKNDDFSDITCNTKAFEFVLPSSTPVSLHKKPLHSLQKFEGQAAATENTRLSVILESSKDKSTNSSSSSLASGCPRTPKNGPVLQFDQKSPKENPSSIPVIPRTSQYRTSSLYPINMLNTIEEESQSILTLTNPSIISGEIEMLPLNDLTYSLKESNTKLYSQDLSLNISCSSAFSLKSFKSSSVQKSLRKSRIITSPKLVVEKENLSPGMLGFPTSSLVERLNSAVPVRRSSRSKLSFRIVKDKENVSPRHHFSDQEHYSHSHEYKTESLNTQKMLLKCDYKTSPIESSYARKSSLSKIPLGTVNTSLNERTFSYFRESQTCSEKVSKSVLAPKASYDKSESPLCNTSLFEASIDDISVQLPPIQLATKTTENSMSTDLVSMSTKGNFHKNCAPKNDYTKKEAKCLGNKKEKNMNSCPENRLECKKKRGRPPKKSNVIEDSLSIGTPPELNMPKKSLPGKKISVTSKKLVTVKKKENVSPLYSPKKLRNRKNNSIQIDDLKFNDIEKVMAPDDIKENVNLVLPNISNDLKSITRKGRKKKIQASVPENFDPFSSSVIEELLGKVGFPKDYHLNNYFVKQTNLPSGTKSMKLGDDVYTIVGEIGKGAYAKVLKANIKSNTVALKIEKPACKWEYYIAKEIQNRIPPKFAAAFMDINAAYIFNNGSVLETQYAKYGSLLRNINLFKEKTGKSLDLGVILHYCIELVDIVQYLHKSKIIHADLKPDNIVVREIPVQNEPEPCIQLIDFGRCIDMSLLPPNIEFDYMFKTEDNKCIEMKEKKPWTYQIDLQGLASIFHCLLVSDYMKVQKKNERWCLQKTLLRTVNREFWNPIFDSLLNVNPSTDLPFDLTTMRKSLVNLLESSLNLHLQQISIYSNVISGK